MGTRRLARRYVDQRLQVLHRGERVVEVVKEALPPLEVGRPTKAVGVILEALPLHKEEVARRRLYAAHQAEGAEAPSRRDDRDSLREGPLEGPLLARDDVEEGVLQDHPRKPAAFGCRRHLV